MNYNKEMVQQALSELATEFENQQEGQKETLSRTFVAKRVRDTATHIERSQNALFSQIKKIDSFDNKLNSLMSSLGMDFNKICKE